MTYRQRHVINVTVSTTTTTPHTPTPPHLLPVSTANATSVGSIMLASFWTASRKAVSVPTILFVFSASIVLCRVHQRFNEAFLLTSFKKMLFVSSVVS